MSAVKRAISVVTADGAIAHVWRSDFDPEQESRFDADVKKSNSNGGGGGESAAAVKVPYPQRVLSRALELINGVKEPEDEARRIPVEELADALSACEYLGAPTPIITALELECRRTDVMSFVNCLSCGVSASARVFVRCGFCDRKLRLANEETLLPSCAFCCGISLGEGGGAVRVSIECPACAAPLAGHCASTCALFRYPRQGVCKCSSP